MAITSLAQLVAEARKLGPVKVAVAAAADPHSLEAIKLGTAAGLIAESDLIGDRERIAAIAATVGLDLGPHHLVDASDDQIAAWVATQLVWEGDAPFLMKGSLPTAVLLKAVLAAEHTHGRHREKHLFSHVAVLEVPTYHKLLLITDAGMVIAPTLEEKIQIVENAVRVAKALGIAQPKVAALAAVETVNPKMVATTDAKELVELAKSGQFPGCVVDGPVSLDVALSAESAQYKGIDSPVAGDTDVFLVPSIEAGNLLGKALIYLARGKMAGVIAGASAPIPLTSRSETSEGKLASIALAILCARR